MKRRSLPAAVAAIAALLGIKSRTVEAAPAAASRRERLCWNRDDWDTTYDEMDIYLLAEDMRPGDVMRTGRAVVMPDVWIALDADDEVREFATEAEAVEFAAAVKAADA